MSLIEHLEEDRWEEHLRRTFEYMLDVLKNDRFRHAGTSVDDLRTWLTNGGISWMKHQLDNQMEMRRLAPERKVAVKGLMEQLIRENRSKLLGLMADGIVPSKQEELLGICDFSELQLQDLVTRMMAGERPFEEWMRAHGHTDEEIDNIYRLIDQWLIKRGIIPSPVPGPSMN
ncbi:MAG: hypothetical protein NTX50_08860 [Candidatus Sumerlaeota bacterium]|nr:hypothetical protein [Candidatus Sumerlaeota bacterium]